MAEKDKKPKSFPRYVWNQFKNSSRYDPTPFLDWWSRQPYNPDYVRGNRPVDPGPGISSDFMQPGYVPPGSLSAPPGTASSDTFAPALSAQPGAVLPPTPPGNPSSMQTPLAGYPGPNSFYGPYGTSAQPGQAFSAPVAANNTGDMNGGAPGDWGPYGGYWQGGAAQGGYTPYRITDENGNKIVNPIYQPRYYQWVQDGGPGSNAAGWRLKPGSGAGYFGDTQALPAGWSSSYSPEYYYSGSGKYGRRGAYDQSQGWNFHPGANLWRSQNGAGANTEHGWMPGWGTLRNNAYQYMGGGPGPKGIQNNRPDAPGKEDQFPEDPRANVASGFTTWKS